MHAHVYPTFLLRLLIGSSLLLGSTLLGSAVVAQSPARSASGADYSRTATTTEATFIHQRPREGTRVLAMVAAGARVGVDVCDDGWCPVRYDGATGFIARQYLTGAPTLPIEAATANPGVYDYDVPVRRSPSPAPAERPRAAEDVREVQIPTIETGFAGSKSSKVFHRASCQHVGRIAPHNLVGYASASEAEAQGKRPCQVCHPTDD